MSLWTCPRGHGRREVDVTKAGAGIPACSVCRSPMQPVVADVPAERIEPSIIPGLAEALAKRDPDLQQEPEVQA